MKKALTILGVILITLVLGFGCNGSGGGNGGDGGDGNGTPILNSHEIYLIDMDCAEQYVDGNDIDLEAIYNNCTTQILNDTVHIGDVLAVVWYGTDSDKDLVGITIWQYRKEGNQYQLYYGPEYVPIEWFTEPQVNFVVVIVGIEVEGPEGQWRINAQVEDAKGHVSNVYKFYVDTLPAPQALQKSLTPQDQESKLGLSGYIDAD